MPRFVALVSAALCAVGACAGTYNIYFDASDQLLSFDQFGELPATVLAPAGVYRGPSDTTIIEIRDAELVISDPDGGNAGEYGAVAIVAQPLGSTFSGGLTARGVVSGVTLENVRDGVYPGLAVGMTMIDASGGTYFFAAINRTESGSDYFDHVLVGGVENRDVLTAGQGYYAVWELNAATPGRVIAAAPIPAGILPDVEFRITVSTAGVASFQVNHASLVTGHALAADPDRAGLVVMNWGTPTGNTPYQNVTFSAYHASGQGVPDGGVPGIPMGAWATTALALALSGGGALRRQR